MLLQVRKLLKKTESKSAVFRISVFRNLFANPTFDFTALVGDPKMFAVLRIWIFPSRFWDLGSRIQRQKREKENYKYNLVFFPFLALNFTKL